MRAQTLLRELGADVRGKRTSPQSHRRHLDACVRWLYRAQDATDCGGCAATYNLVLGWGDPYPETTGYIVPTLYDYAALSGEDEPRRRAERMAEWLLTTQLPSGAFPGGTVPAASPSPSVFNTGQIVFGLLRAHEETGRSEYLGAVQRACEWLVEVQHEGGYWQRHDYRSARHAYASRVAWALLEAAERTDDSEFREAALANLEWVRSVQRPSGWFDYCGFDEESDPFLHTIAYTIRGLLEGGLLADDEPSVEAARTTADVLLRRQSGDGPLRGRFGAGFDADDFYCLTGNAQMAVVWQRLAEHTGEKRYERAAETAIDFLRTRHRLEGPDEVRGALPGSDPVWGPYMYLRYPNWAAKFFADALLGTIRSSPPTVVAESDPDAIAR